MRVNGARVQKSSHAISPGDVLTFSQARNVRVILVDALSDRRGPAPEAQTLYTDMTEKQDVAPVNPRFEGKGRPAKKDRRALDLSRRSGAD